MSAAAVWDGTTGGYAVPRPSRRRVERPRLVLVPTGADVVEPAPARLRLTRAGRLALTVGVLLAAMAVAAVVLVGGASASGAPETVTVQPGQTLSEIAAEHLGGVPVQTAVAEIQLANGLSTARVSAGQTLVMPQG